MLHLLFVDSIEANIDAAVDNVEAGQTQLQKAATYQVCLSGVMGDPIGIIDTQPGLWIVCEKKRMRLT